MQKVLEVINNINNVFMRKLVLIMAVLLMGTFANAQDGKKTDPVKKEVRKAAKKVKKEIKKDVKKLKKTAKKDMKKVKKAVKK